MRQTFCGFRERFSSQLPFGGNDFGGGKDGCAPLKGRMRPCAPKIEAPVGYAPTTALKITKDADAVSEGRVCV